MTEYLTNPTRLSTIAPAGCGKTHLIVTSVKQRVEGRSLVLTHTNAGVSVLEQRFKSQAVPSDRYTVETIDGWCLRLVRSFPQRGGLRLGDELPAWSAIRSAAERIVRKPFFGDILRSSYGHIYVDEYQDCSAEQHAVIVALSEIAATRTLGDPLQAIFSFGEMEGNQLSWPTQVCSVFPLKKLTWKPRRWTSNEPLADFVVKLRRQLVSGSPISLRHPAVEIIPDDRSQILTAIRYLDSNATSLVIHGQRLQCYALARNVKAGFKCLEPVSLDLLPKFAAAVAAGTSLDFANSILDVVEECTDAGKAHLEPVRKRLLNPTLQRRLKDEAVMQTVTLCRRLIETGKTGDALALLENFESAYVFRPEPFYGLRRALRSCASSALGLSEAIERQRERDRHMGRRMPQRAMGTTYLVKGLEADHVVAMDLHTMGASDLYVALTRAKGRLIVVSSTDTLPPPIQSSCVKDAIAAGLLTE